MSSENLNPDTEDAAYIEWVTKAISTLVSANLMQIVDGIPVPTHTNVGVFIIGHHDPVLHVMEQIRLGKQVAIAFTDMLTASANPKIEMKH